MDDLTQELYAPRPAPPVEPMVRDADVVELHPVAEVKQTRHRLDQPTLGAALNDIETAVLRGIADGRTYKYIGRERDMATDTVKWYAKRVYRKLGARSGAHAVHIAHTRGILIGDRVGVPDA